ncbi:uncharacterized protein ABDE67_018447 [Symphorus nematophorus]
MMMSLSASRWMCLLTLGVVMLFSASQVDSMLHARAPCCFGGQSEELKHIKDCYEQKPRPDCQHHFFIITTKRNKKFCVRPDAEWLTQRLETGDLACLPVVSNVGKLEFLDEDMDMK